MSRGVDVLSVCYAGVVVLDEHKSIAAVHVGHVRTVEHGMVDLLADPAFPLVLAFAALVLPGEIQTAHAALNRLYRFRAVVNGFRDEFGAIAEASRDAFFALEALPEVCLRTLGTLSGARVGSEPAFLALAAGLGDVTSRGTFLSSY